MGVIHELKTCGNHVQRDADACPSFVDMEEFLGGIPECVWVLFKGKRTAMFVNGNGLLLNLPFNARATEVYHEFARVRGLVNDHPIVGDALLLEGIHFD